MEVDPPRSAASRSEESSPAATPAPPAAPDTTKDAAATAVKPRLDGDATSSRSTQTRPAYLFSEPELVDLLIRFEQLYEQEQTAMVERISHETALPLVRRCLRDGVPVPADLLTARPLAHPPPRFDHVGEHDWVQFEDPDDGSDEEAQGAPDDLLLEADRDLTDEELARIYTR